MKKYPLKLLVISLLLFCITGFSQKKEKDNLVKDAVAIWHMADAKNVINKGGPIIIMGEVKLGVKLKDNESEKALLHFSAGNVASLEGGYLIAGNDKLQV